MISTCQIIKKDSEYFEELKNIFLKRIEFHNHICETFSFNNLKISLKKELFFEK
jgi:hypothetical protein